MRVPTQALRAFVFALGLVACSAPAALEAPTAAVATPTIKSPSRLAAFPRPPNDNGWGVHWAATLFTQPKDVVDYFVGECQMMGIKWVKFLHGDAAKFEHEYLARTLVAHGMMPVMRVYKTYNEPYEHLRELVRAAREAGVPYFELYNEPNVSGRAGGWRDGEPISVGRLIDLWIPAAETIIQAGSYPGLPSLSPGGDYDDNDFLRAWLDELKKRGRHDLLTKSWLPLHNYFLNHPVDYPYDPVNLKSVPLSAAEIAQRKLTPQQVAAINQARQIARLPRAQGGYYVSDNIFGDSNAFRKFEAYERIFVERFGYEIPIISTEGGALAGAQEDPRYPPVTDDDVSASTLYAYQYLIEQAPAYYFAFMPWLLANFAGGHGDSRFEAAAWYKAINGPTLPVVDALTHNPMIGRTRKNTP